MSHYEKSLEADVEKIRAGVLGVAAAVEANLEAALRALTRADRDLAYKTILLDHPINRGVERVDDICHHFVVRHLPSAGHLRFISSVLRMNVELERIGDYAETICHEVASLTGPIEGHFRLSVDAMGRDALDMYRSAVDAFREQNDAKARQTMSAARAIERDFHVAYEQLASEGEEGVGSTRDRFSKLVVLSSLERVADQSKNLCEEVVWALSGERKRRRPMRVVFFDPTNEVLGPLAIAAARKSHPTVGAYFMAASSPADHVRSDVHEFLEGTGHDLTAVTPTAVTGLPGELSDYDVFVSLQGQYSDYIERVPFGSAAVNWTVPDGDASVEDRYRSLLSNVVELMDTIRGPEAEHAR